MILDSGTGSAPASIDSKTRRMNARSPGVSIVKRKSGRSNPAGGLGASALNRSMRARRYGVTCSRSYGSFVSCPALRRAATRTASTAAPTGRPDSTTWSADSRIEQIEHPRRRVDVDRRVVRRRAHQEGRTHGIGNKEESLKHVVDRAAKDRRTEPLGLPDDRLVFVPPCGGDDDRGRLPKP